MVKSLSSQSSSVAWNVSTNHLEKVASEKVDCIAFSFFSFCGCLPVVLSFIFLYLVLALIRSLPISFDLS